MTRFIAMGRRSDGLLVPIAVDANGKIALASGDGELIFETLIVGDYPNNYFEVESDGTWQSVGNATTWDDFAVSASRARQGVAQKPDFDFTNLGLLFPQNDAAEIVYIIAQNSHAKLMNSDISYHVHYIQSVATQPTFCLDYKYYKNGAVVPVGFTTICTSDVGGDKGLFTYPGSGSILQIGELPAITPPADETVSSNLDVKFYRNDNDVAGDVLVKYIDFHYQINTSGSRQEYTK